MNSKTKNINEQDGSMLVLSLIILGIIVAISLSITALLIPRAAIIREISNSVPALYSADSAMEWCIYEIRYSERILKPQMSTSISVWGGTPPGYLIKDVQNPIEGNECPYDDEYNHGAVGTYGGVSRALCLGPGVASTLCSP